MYWTCNSLDTFYKLAVKNVEEVGWAVAVDWTCRGKALFRCGPQEWYQIEYLVDVNMIDLTSSSGNELR